MHDPAYRKQLDGFHATEKGFVKEMLGYKKRLAAIETWCGGDKAKAEAMPEYAEIKAKMADCEKRVAANHAACSEAIRARHRQALADSERIRKGEARAVSIPAAKAVPPSRPAAKAESVSKTISKSEVK